MVAPPGEGGGVSAVAVLILTPACKSAFHLRQTFLLLASQQSLLRRQVGCAALKTAAREQAQVRGCSCCFCN